MNILQRLLISLFFLLSSSLADLKHLLLVSSNAYREENGYTRNENGYPLAIPSIHNKIRGTLWFNSTLYKQVCVDDDETSSYQCGKLATQFSFDYNNRLSAIGSEMDFGL